MDLDQNGQPTHYLLNNYTHHCTISLPLPRTLHPQPLRTDLSCYSAMNSQDNDINDALSNAYEYLPKSIISLLTDLKNDHRLLSIIKAYDEEEADIYIPSISTPHSFIVLDIDDLFEKSIPSLNNFLSFPLQTCRTKIPTAS